MGLLIASFFVGLVATGIRANAAADAAEEAAQDAKDKAEADAASYANLAEQARLNADIAEANALRATQVGEEQAARISRQGLVQLGKNIVGQATGAFSTRVGSTKGQQQEFSAGVSRDVNQTLENAQFQYEQAMAESARFELEAQGYEDQSTYYSDYAADLDPEAIGAKTKRDVFFSGFFEGLGSLFGSTAGIGSDAAAAVAGGA